MEQVSFPLITSSLIFFGSHDYVLGGLGCFIGDLFLFICLHIWLLEFLYFVCTFQELYKFSLLLHSFCHLLLFIQWFVSETFSHQNPQIYLILCFRSGCPWVHLTVVLLLDIQIVSPFLLLQIFVSFFSRNQYHALHKWELDKYLWNWPTGELSSSFDFFTFCLGG